MYNETRDDLWDPLVKEVHYCTYPDFLSGNIPEDAILLVDEIDTLFFSDTPKIVEARLVSSVLLLSKYRVYGMSATFRGEQGKRKMKRLLNDSNFIETSHTVKERNLDVQIYKVSKTEDILNKVVEVSMDKIKEMPVIVILKSMSKCQ